MGWTGRGHCRGAFQIGLGGPFLSLFPSAGLWNGGLGEAILLSHDHSNTGKGIQGSAEWKHSRVIRMLGRRCERRREAVVCGVGRTT